MITKTSTILLDGLSNPNDSLAWGEFYGRYAPIIVAFGRKLGLETDDAEDLAQSTMAEFVKSFRAGHYDRSRARLRSWVFGIAENLFRNMRRKAAGHGKIGGESAMIDLAEPDRLEALWDAEWHRAVVDAAMEELRTDSRVDAKTIYAFQLVTFAKLPAKEVADQLGMSESGVNVAAHRVRRRLAEILRHLRDEF